MKILFVKKTIRVLSAALSWLRRHHELLVAATAIVGVAVAVISTKIAIQAFESQLVQNALTQRQIELQQQQFLAGRRTELAKVIFDPSNHISLRSYALREFIGLEQRPFAKTGLDEGDAVSRWKEAAQETDFDERKKKLRSASIWRCEEYHDGGGGSGSTVRRVLDLRNANLAGIDLSNISLSCVDFSGSDLSGADFTGAEFSGVVLDGVKLKGAQFGMNAIFWTFVYPAGDLEAEDRESMIFERNFGTYVAVPCFTRKGYTDKTKVQIKISCPLDSAK